MDYTNRLQKVTVLGAAGKMGSGILLLTAMEVTDLMLQNKDLKMALYAIDVSADGLSGLLKYVHSQVIRAAEKKTVLLRKLYADRSDLIENGDVIEQYVQDVVGTIRTSIHLQDAYDSSLVFEAIKEDPKLKISILKDIDTHSRNEPWFFTNTSSIPIRELDQGAELNGRMVGFHFYNPPAVQKLVELIPAEQTLDELVEFAQQYAKNLRKKVVPSNDFAGFIGNGHFMRDALYGIQQVEKLQPECGFAEAVCQVNQVSQDFLLRPMGIFQLIDYVGIDVVSYIMKVMNPHLPDENLHSELLTKLLDLNVNGGQFSDGSQKDGFFQYMKGRPVSVFDIDKEEYVDITGPAEFAKKALGELPSPLNWKTANFSPDKQTLLTDFFAGLTKLTSPGAKMAQSYAQNSKKIGELLVSSGVAASPEHVNQVLQTGFYHAYGPINNYFN